MAAALPLRVAGFREGLRAGGYRETDNIELLSRAADGDPTRIARLAMELAGRKVDVMVPVSPAAVHAALAASALLELGTVEERIVELSQCLDVLLPGAAETEDAAAEDRGVLPRRVEFVQRRDPQRGVGDAAAAAFEHVGRHVAAVDVEALRP